MNGLHCIVCQEILTGRQRKFCSDKCRSRDQKDGQLAKRKQRRNEDQSKERRGKTYQKITDAVVRGALDLEAWLDHNTVTNRYVAKLVDASEASVARTKQAFYIDRELIEARVEFEISTIPQELLGPDHAEMARMAVEDPEAFEVALDLAVIAFSKWRTKYIHLAPNKPFITRKFHLRWIRNTLKVIYTGGRGMIMSPPRHGKSELLVHFCVWLIIRNPDIRILWVGPNQEIAENMLGLVQSHLEENIELLRDYLPPGDTWKPRARGKLWSRTKFAVSQQDYRIKQPTMWCVGVGGRILSMDCDFIIVDDPDDPDKAATEGGRLKTLNWFRIKLATRKMMHTGLMMISSRVHILDLYSTFIDDTETWDVLVDKAHDQSKCGKSIVEFHTPEETECILFDEINPWEYLVEQLNVVGMALFEMIYLNQPRPDSILIFNPDLIREGCLDWTRGIGVDKVPERVRLIAGLDPASRATQAAFLWGYGDETGKTYMIDLETQKAGGVEGAIRVMRDWHERYGCEIWIVEDNGYQKTFFDDPRVRALKVELGLTIQPTHTGKIKHDADFGVAAMAAEYHEGNISLPYLGREAQRKVDMLIKELTVFTSEAKVQRRNQSDILMAHWFPWSRVIKSWRTEGFGEKKVQPNYHPSYSGVRSLTGASHAPWGGTMYPGGR